MKKLFQTAAVVAVCTSMAAQAAAEATTTPAAPSKKDAGSVWVQCDGQPADMSAGELAAYLLAITATGGIVGGLVGAPETGDVGKRLKGAEGVAACEQAFARETDTMRKVQLQLARGVHRVEAKAYEDALVDIRTASGVAGTQAEEGDFRRTIGLSAMELEAATLVRMGKPAEAEAVALAMAEVAPYDVLNQLRALPYAGLTAKMTPAKQAYFERLVKIYPTALFSRYEARLWDGDFVGAAADLERFDTLHKAFFDEAEPMTLSLARRAAAYMLAGDMKRSEEVAVAARAAVEKLIRSGKASESAAVIAQAEELLDFQAVGRKLAEGRVAEARAAFAARSRWLAPKAPAVAVLTERLRAGAAPSELTGALARTPAEIIAEGLAIEAAAIAEPANEAKALFGALRPYQRNAHSAYTRAVWKTDKSRYLVKKTEKAKYNGDLMFIYGAYGQAGGEAMLLHAALLARHRGFDGFMMGPVRTKLDNSLVMFVNAGGPGAVDGMVVNAADVIAALSPEMPEPVKSR